MQTTHASKLRLDHTTRTQQWTHTEKTTPSKKQKKDTKQPPAEQKRKGDSLLSTHAKKENPDEENL